MSTSPGEDAVRSRISSKWTQPVSRGADENIKLARRKVGQNLRPARPGAAAGDLANRMRLPGSPVLMAQLAQPREIFTSEAPSQVGSVGADEAADLEDKLAQAWQARMANQWERVTETLLRDLAPGGGADADAVLAHIAEQRAILDSATVRDYLPVLVDRAVRQLFAPDEAGG